MGERRILIVGSQCEALKPGFSFLPDAAEDLYRVMTDPQFGGCVSALERSGLLCDTPTVAETKAAIKTALERASNDGATLFLVFICHGQYVGDDFYLLPNDASREPDSESAVHLVNLIKESLRKHSNVDGLVILLDTCYSGKAVEAAAEDLVKGPLGVLRFEVLAATEADRTAADGCFSRSLVSLIREGIDGVPGATLLCDHIRPELAARCPNQQPVYLLYDRGSRSQADEGLFLARNVALDRRHEPWAGKTASAELERLTAWFQPTPQLAQVVAASQAHRAVALVGVAGCGKSALAAALARPELTEGLVPEGFVQAIVFLSQATTTEGLAEELAEQLRIAIPDFAGAREQFLRHVTQDELATLSSLEREVVGPLRWLPAERTVRLVVDGLDQLSAGTVSAVQSALNTLVGTNPGPPQIRLVVTSRPDTPLPGGADRVDMGRADDAHIRSHLKRRKLPEALQEPVVARADGNWLVARLLADLAAADPDVDPTALPSDLIGIYDGVLQRAGAAETDRWRKELRPVLGAVAAAGVDPILPLQLLCAASGNLGGPHGVTQVRDIVVDLRGFVVRGSPGTDAEQVGAFHQTFADYLLDPSAGVFGIAPKEAHAALAEAIGELAPMETHDQDDPLHRYAGAREAEHLWATGRHKPALACLAARESVFPAENLQRWRSWEERVQAILGPDHPDTLTTRNNIAAWTGETGDGREALRLFQELLPDQERVLGPDHPDTLATRNDIAACTGGTGDAREALRLFRELLPDQERVLGPDHPDTLTTRSNIATWTGQTGDPREALRLFQELLPDKERVLGPDHPNTLTTRSNIAAWTEGTGDAREALRLFQELLPDQERVLGPDHPDTLTTRSNIAACTGETGDAREALRLFRELLPDRERVLGPDHPATLTTRNNIAAWTGETGDAREALRLYQELFPDRERVLGPDHPDTLMTRGNIAAWTGDACEALRLFQELLPDHERVLGPDHPDTLTTRNNIAHWTGGTGDAREALRLYEELLPDRERVLGPDHPGTLTTRNNIAGWTGRTGDAREALRLSQELLPDQERVLGPDHPDTLVTRRAIRGLQDRLR